MTIFLGIKEYKLVATSHAKTFIFSLNNQISSGKLFL
jgi:hypothetical protein